MDKIASNSQAQWITGGNQDVFTSVTNAVSKALAAGAIPVLVAYNIPQRDCGGMSATVSTVTVDGYQTWVSAFARGLGTSRSVIILEPDALAQSSCLSSADQAARIALISAALVVLKAQGAVVYLDGGNSGWNSPSAQASLLKRARVDAADGFFLNVSSFSLTASSITYGRAVSGLINAKHFVIDTSRNGQGPTDNGVWCNPQGRGLGVSSTTITADSLVDAYLWIKSPGESDGACNGGPAAGAWMEEYALGLAQRSAM